MPFNENLAAQRVRDKVRTMRGQFRQGQGREAETLYGFRDRVERELGAVPTMEAFEMALPPRFRSYLIRDPAEQRNRASLGTFLRVRMVDAGTADLGYKGFPMTPPAERLRSVVRYYLENTNRKALADEFDRVMTIEPDTEIERQIRILKPELGHDTAQALAEEKRKRAYARGALLAKLSEEFAELTPETLEQPTDDMGYRRLSRPYLYLNALASQMGAMLAAPENRSDILFAPADREKCKKLMKLQPVAERVVRQMEVMSNPCYQYLDVTELIRNMDHETCRDMCQELADQGGIVGNFAQDVKAVQETSLGYIAEEVATEADNAMQALHNACGEGIQGLKKQVDAADPFYLVNGSPEFDVMKNSVEAYSKRRPPELRDPDFLEKLRGLAQATKKLYKDSCRYLKYKGEEVTGKNGKKRVEAAKAVRDYAVKQMDQLKELKRLKNVMEDFDIEARRKLLAKNKASKRNTVVTSGKAPKLPPVPKEAEGGRKTEGDPTVRENPFPRNEFYKKGKKFAVGSFRQANENTAELDRRLKLMFFPDRGFDLYGALGLDGQAPPEEPLADMELETARELISHLAMKRMLRDEQRRAERAGVDSKIVKLAGGISVDEFREFMNETPSMQKALTTITRKDVYELVAGENGKALKNLSRKAAVELPKVAEAHLNRNQEPKEKNPDQKVEVMKEQKPAVMGKGAAK